MQRLRIVVPKAVVRFLQPRVHLATMSTRPMSPVYGFDRGLPADRRLVERFLAENAASLHGRVLEVGDDRYVRRFGGDRLTAVDVLDVDPGNERATIVADLERLETVPDATFDCAVIVFVLQYLKDPRQGIRELHRVLVDGGTALVALPSLDRVDTGGAPDRWRFLPAAVDTLFDGTDWDLDVQAKGNALLGIAMWTGLAVEDLPRRAWDVDDPVFPCVVNIRATKRASPTPRS